jgi:alcohol sulfotransferase
VDAAATATVARVADLRQKIVRRLTRLAVAVLPEAPGRRVGHWLRGREERSRLARADLVVLSHAKSGRTWLRAMLSHLFHQRHGIPESRLMEFEDFHAVAPAVPRILFTHGHYLGSLFDAGRVRVEPERRRMVLLVRDPCDVAVSQYFHFARRTKPYKRRLQGLAEDGDVDMFDFVMESPLGLPGILEHRRAWTRRLAERSDARIVRYEDLRADPARELAALCDFLGLDATPDEIAKAVDFASFESLKEKERSAFFEGGRLSPADPDDPDSYKVRRAVVGGYRDYFSEEQIARLEARVRRGLEGVDAPAPA